MVSEVAVWGPALLSAGCASAGVLTLGGSAGRRVRRRVQVLREEVGQSRARRVRALSKLREWARARTGDPALREGAAALGALGFGVGVLGGTTGLLVGAAGAYAVWRWLRRRRPPAGQHPEPDGSKLATTQLPITADLLAACLAAGSTPGGAAEAVGRALEGPLGERLVRAAGQLRLGADPAAVWQRFGELPGSAGLSRCMERAGMSGAPAVEPVTRVAAELRAERARLGAARARRAAVLVTGPLGLCFLPAFLAVGVAPVVVGLSRSLL